MSTTEKMSVAALLSVNLRRKASCSIDVQWLLENDEYAREIIKFSRAQGHEDLTDYANNLEKLLFGKVADEAVTPVNVKSEQQNSAFRNTLIDWAAEGQAVDSETEEVETLTDKKNYIGHLR